MQDTTHNPPLPLPIKLGDVNQDGFPDLLAILASGSASRPDRIPYIAYNVPCARGGAGCDENGKGKRAFKVLKRGGDVLGGIRDARGAAFLDLDEDVGFFFFRFFWVILCWIMELTCVFGIGDA